MRISNVLLLSAALVISKASACIPDCWAEKLGFKCCENEDLKVEYTDENGDWGVENGDWCGILRVNPYVNCLPAPKTTTTTKTAAPTTSNVPNCQFYNCISITSIGEDGTLYSKNDHGTCKMNLKDSSCKRSIEYYAKPVLLGYPLCKEKHEDDLVRDEDGYWAIEDGNWCGVQVCPRCEVESIDKYGNIWGTDGANGNKCIVDKESSECNYTLQTTCRSAKVGYKCCKETTEVVARDSLGFWGVENGQWCGLNNPFPCAHYTELGYKCCDEIKVNFNNLTFTKDGIFTTVNKETCGVSNDK
ncbi:hypothetical protein BCR36DRAFT_585585 [Piromyces finnis]|uniref:CBM10 domain-containing protein n=1 Tax=Piromyces finnis TaxID=1754191 RepID=A0A1Y1V237_9FUNG|nr:hypothetical protein BCR36DRAFT_585585 [Piromyces finnis]|eukprot:ORX45558.1 hypothetical protein BCR36DRAFT_585585 [Piromyces finnis]